MEFLRVKLSGCLNSFRQPDFHTYHKTLPLPPKTTIAGMLGAALGISPKVVNDEWLINDRFRMGIFGISNGKANDLWQIRKFENKQISAFKKFRDDIERHNLKEEYEVITPYKTAVIVRELLFASEYILYLNFDNSADLDLIKRHLENPVWALSIGREDELVKITAIDEIEIQEKEDVFLKNTVVATDTNSQRYEIDLTSKTLQVNLLQESPKIVRLPINFIHKKDGDAREANTFQDFTFISQLPIRLKGSKAFWDDELDIAFQIF